MPNFSGKKGIVDEAEVLVNPRTPNTITGFTSEDFVFLDLSLAPSQVGRYFVGLVKQGMDLVAAFHSVRTGKAAATTTIKGVYTTDGIEFLESGAIEGVEYDTSVVAIFKSFASKAEANASKEDANWEDSLIIGTQGADVLHSADGVSNRFFDNGGDDQAFGADNDDEFYDGLGSDTLTGGAGGDEFYFRSVHHFSTNGTLSHTKTITDFKADQGDKIILSDLVSAHKMRFNEEGTASNWRRGDLVFQVNGSDGWLLGNIDRDKDPEFKIVLSGVTTLPLEALYLGE